MKKLLSALVIGIIFLLAVGVFTAAKDISTEVDDALNEFSKNEVKEEVKSNVQDLVDFGGIDAKEITNVSLVDLNNLPLEIEVEEVSNENDVAIYEIGYNKSSSNKQFFVIKYSKKVFNLTRQALGNFDRELLSFGSNEAINGSSFLKTASGTFTSLTGGYVMMKAGSITGISTDLEIVNSNREKLEIIVYKNGEDVRFGNAFDSSTLGKNKDFDIQSESVVNFVAGDVISVYVQANNGTQIKGVTTLVEVIATVRTVKPVTTTNTTATINETELVEEIINETQTTDEEETNEAELAEENSTELNTESNGSLI